MIGLSLSGIAIPIPIKGLQVFDHPNNITFNNNHTCLLSPEGFGDFKVYGSLTAFFIPLIIMMIIYLLTIQVLRKKAYLLRSRATRPNITTVFQQELPALSSPEKVPIANGIKRDRTPNRVTRDEVPLRRMSTIGKRSMQNLSNEQRASKVLGIVFMLFVVMWCPFFITNVTSVLCQGCNSNLVEQLLDIFQWVGYVSSGINPLVYTLFNRTFRQAFTRYITCNYRRVRTPKMQRRSRIYFRSSVTENSKRFMKHSKKNGISPVSYQSPLRHRPTHLQTSANNTLDMLLLAGNEDCKSDEHVSHV